MQDNETQNRRTAKTSVKAEKRKRRKRTGAIVSEELFTSAEQAYIEHSQEMARRLKCCLDEGQYVSEIARLNFEALYKHYSDVAEGRKKVRL